MKKFALFAVLIPSLLIGKNFEVAESGDSKKEGQRLVSEIGKVTATEREGIRLSASNSSLIIPFFITDVLVDLRFGVRSFPNRPIELALWPEAPTFLPPQPFGTHSDELAPLTMAELSSLFDFSGEIGTAPRGEPLPRLVAEQQLLALELDLSNPFHRELYPKHGYLVIHNRADNLGFPKKPPSERTLFEEGNIFGVLRTETRTRSLWNEANYAPVRPLSTRLQPNKIQTNLLQSIILGRIDLEDFDYFAISSNEFSAHQRDLKNIKDKEANDFPSPEYFLAVTQRRAIWEAFFKITSAAGIPVYLYDTFDVSTKANSDPIELHSEPINHPKTQRRSLSPADLDRLLGELSNQIIQPDMNRVFLPGSTLSEHASRFREVSRIWQHNDGEGLVECLSQLSRFAELVLRFDEL